MNILIVKLSPVYDLYNAMPTVHILKKFYNAKITWVVHEFFVELVQCFSDVNKVVLYPENELKHINRKKFRIDLHSINYDLIIDLEGSMESALVCKSSRKNKNAKILGPSFQREGSFKLYDEITGCRDVERDKYIQCMDVLRHLNIPINEINYNFNLSNLYNKNNEIAYNVINTLSRNPKKNLPLEICDRYISQSIYKTFVLSDRNNAYLYEDLEENYSSEKIEIIEKKLSITDKLQLFYYSNETVCCNYDDIQLISALNLNGIMINIDKKNNYPKTCNKLCKIINIDNAKTINFN